MTSNKRIEVHLLDVIILSLDYVLSFPHKYTH
jgi:hypothetical protein